MKRMRWFRLACRTFDVRIGFPIARTSKMSVLHVRNDLVARLDEDDRGDRGWWVMTRVHVSPRWLKGIADYLERRTNGAPLTLTASDYRVLSTIIRSNAYDPGQQLRRHHLLVMDKPLQLLRRSDGVSWQKIEMTRRGQELAYADDIGKVLEDSLSEIRFAKAPWFPPKRVSEYPAYDIQVYRATEQVLRRTDGYIDRDEFDLFLSRVRHTDEISGAIGAIMEYRKLDIDERGTLHEEVRNRILGKKAYQNWRDVGLHTFSLFSLGTSMIRSDCRLMLTEQWVDRNFARTSTRVETELRIPEPPADDRLLVPPCSPAGNDGTGAESFVAKVLRSKGWRVVFYTSMRGYGFDLWACRHNRPMVIEVKSSIGKHGTVTLTQSEYLAARKYGDSYVLAVVESISTQFPRLTLIQNPLRNTAIVERETKVYQISRKNWTEAAARLTELD